MPDRMLWQSNAPWAASGYGQQSGLFVPRFAQAGLRMAMSCFYGLEGGIIEWQGIPCYPTDPTRYGLMMLGDYAAHFAGGDRGNCWVFTLQDTWPLLPGAAALSNLRLIHWTPVDHDPVPPNVVKALQGTKGRVVAMSDHGRRALEKEGFEPLYVPHGVDTNVFKVASAAEKAEIRKTLRVPQDAFVVGMVACNQGLPSRKSYPQVFEAFAEFHKRHSDTILYVHADILGRNNTGVNLVEIGQALGIPGDAIHTSDQVLYYLGLPNHVVAGVYNAFDVLAMPSRGEGFGIPAIESQACGVPVILSDWTAMTEMCGAGWLVGGTREWDQTQSSYQLVPHVGDILDAMEQAYDQAAGMGEQAVRFASAYDVDRVMADHWLPVLQEIVTPREVQPLQALEVQPLRAVAA